MLHVPGHQAETLAAHALMRRLETGRARGFGSVRVKARIGGSCWQTSAFPSGDGGWIVLIKAAIRRAEDIHKGDQVDLFLQLE